MTPICLQRKIIPALELRPPSAIPLLEADPVSLVRDLMKAKYIKISTIIKTYHKGQYAYENRKNAHCSKTNT